jgi:3D (Asp-Asp-Asp) domain-containing protein
VSPRTPGPVHAADRADRRTTTRAPAHAAADPAARPAKRRRRPGKRTLVAAGAAALVLGAAVVALPILNSAGGPDAAAANSALDPSALDSAGMGAAAPAPGAAPAASPVGVTPAATPPDGATARVPDERRTPVLKAAQTARHPVPARALSPAKKSTAEPASSEKSEKRSTAKITPSAGKTGRKLSVDLTGYSWFDNTPAGSSEVSHPIVHKDAGGTGTYSDPVTVAVASSSFKPGTRFYIPTLQRYAIVEDSGASSGTNHLDVWVGGKGGSKSGASSCMDKFTGKASAEQNPPPGRPVLAGPIYSGSGCKLPKT